MNPPEYDQVMVEVLDDLLDLIMDLAPSGANELPRVQKIQDKITSLRIAKYDLIDILDHWQYGTATPSKHR